MKFIPGFLKRKPALDPTQPDLKPAEAPREDKPGFFSGLKDKLRRKKPESGNGAEPAEKKQSLVDLQAIKNRLSSLMQAKDRGHKINTLLVITGAGVAVAGVAADMMFLGGVGTLTVVSCLYSDLRNRQQIGKISSELAKIDGKIDEMRATKQAVPDYAPALSAVKSSIEDFQSSAKKVPPEVAEDLAKLKDQVQALQDKIKPANDDDGAAPKKPGMTG